MCLIPLTSKNHLVGSRLSLFKVLDYFTQGISTTGFEWTNIAWFSHGTLCLCPWGFLTVSETGDVMGHNLEVCEFEWRRGYVNCSWSKPVTIWMGVWDIISLFLASDGLRFPRSYDLLKMVKLCLMWSVERLVIDLHNFACLLFFSLTVASLEKHFLTQY